MKLIMAVAAAIMLVTFATGFYRDLSAGSEETYKGLKLFSDVIELVEKNYVDEVDSKELIEKAIQGMVQSLDPHSQFLPPEAFQELQVDTKGEFGGIGIVITVRKGVITVVSPIEGTPAYKAGIKAGDIVIKVDGESTKDMALWEAVKRMRGPKGEPVVLTIVREGNADPIDFELIRAIIPVKSVKSIALKPGFGYVWVTNFTESTTSELKENLSKLESGEEPLRGLILDLRDNPGGLLSQAIDVSDLFLHEGIIVSIKGRQRGNTKKFSASSNLIKRTYPIVALINGGTASASEIVAGALQDQKRALILGTTSFGKGSVQTVETLRSGYGLKFTIARYYTPSGKSIQAQGIVPDITVKHEILSDEEVAQDTFLKEKDLKNHLDAQPGPEKKEEMEEKKESEEPLETLTKDRHIPLSREKLLSDSQIRRAVEILLSHDIIAGRKR